MSRSSVAEELKKNERVKILVSSSRQNLRLLGGGIPEMRSKRSVHITFLPWGASRLGVAQIVLR